jgi:outer membrane lipoprotein-sorting protein
MRKEGPGLMCLLQIVALSLAGLFTAGSPEGAFGADFTVETIQKAYENIKDIKGSFVQKSTIKDLKRTDTFRGTFVIKVPSKMRWQYQGEGKEVEVIVNGGELTIYQKSDKQALKGRFDKDSYGQAPLALLGGFGSIEKEFDAGKKDGRLLLTPKRSMGVVTSVEVAPSEGDFPIGSLIITDKRSNRIEITFREVVLNTGVKDTAFSFSAPEGVSVFEYSKPQ